MRTFRLIGFFFSLLLFVALLFPLAQYATPPCAGLDTTHSQCLPATAPPPPNTGGHTWTVIPSGACSSPQNKCYARDDSCPIKYQSTGKGNPIYGACSNPNSQLACQGWQQTSDTSGCDQAGGNTICYSLSEVNPAPTPKTCNATPGKVNNPCPNNVCDTALGSIDVSTGGAFVKILFQVLLSLSGGIALLIIIFAGFSMALSQGNPEKVKGAQETLTGAIVGLLFIILSVAILQIIGVNILGLPGFKQ